MQILPIAQYEAKVIRASKHLITLMFHLLMHTFTLDFRLGMNLEWPGSENGLEAVLKPS